MDYLGLGKRVKESREKNGMTQQQLAEKISFSIQHISNIGLERQNYREGNKSAEGSLPGETGFTMV